MASGRLSLSWIGRDKTLLNTPDGGYEWVSRHDPRVSEVRLLQEVDKSGDVTGTAADNLLIRGDSRDALVALTRIPEYAEHYRGKVKLVYIDPPFNTGQAFELYDDALEHSVWLTMMRDRLLLIRDLLAPDGSVWVHLDDAEMAYCRVLMDEIFGRANFSATVIWEKTTSSRNDARIFSTDQDYILVYSRNPDSFSPKKVAHTAAADKAYKNQDNDPRGPWREVDYKCPKTADERPNLYYPIIHPFTGEKVWPRRERVWAYGKDEHERHISEGLLFWGKTGKYKFPKLKKFLTERNSEGTPPRTLWLTTEVDQSRTAKNESKNLFPESSPFTTPKPERLLQRVVHLSTDPGDIVLDCFGGSGTTAAVAHKMGRRWVTSEILPYTVENYTFPRLQKVVDGEDPGGITEMLGWQGGNGFRRLEVAPSAFEVSGERVFFRDWVKDEHFAEVIAAQLGFIYKSGLDSEPFCGRRGRVRLAVIDGVVDDVVARAVLGQLDEGERTVIVGRGVTPEAQHLALKISPGSKVMKAPRDLVHNGKAVR